MKPLQIIFAGLALLGLIVLALSFQRRMERGLPTRVECASIGDAAKRASDWAREHGGDIRFVSGTGSMSPFIPAAPTGKDPRSTIVAITVTDPKSTFDSIQPGDLCVYRADWFLGTIIHQAAQKDRLGWIMSGLANARSESFARMTEEHFIGRVAVVFVWEDAAP